MQGKVKFPELTFRFLIGFTGENSIAYLQRMVEHREAPDVVRLEAHRFLGWPQEGEIEARRAFLDTLQDPHRGLLEFLSQAAAGLTPDEEVTEESIGYVLALLPLDRLALVEEVAARFGGEASLFFRALLHTPITETRHPALSWLVSQGDRGALRAMRRLSALLKEPLAQAEVVAAIRGLEIEPAKRGGGIEPVFPFEGAYLSVIDGDGAQVVIGVRRYVGNTVKFASVLHKDYYGIKDTWGRIVPDPREVNEVISKLASGVGKMARVPLEAVQQILMEAATVNARLGNPIPPAFEVWEHLFYDDPRQDVPSGSYPQLDDKPFVNEQSLLEESPRLLDTIEFDSWIFGTDEVAPYVSHGRRRITAARIATAIQGIVNEETRALLRSRLQRQAWILDHERMRKESKWALAASAALRPDSGVKLAEHPFLQAMVRLSLENVMYSSPNI